MPEDPKSSLEFLLGQMNQNLTDINAHLKELNGKVARHEKFINESVGRSSVWGIIGGLVSSLAFLIIGKILHK